MVHQPDYIEVYRVIFNTFMADNSKDIYAELHTIYGEAISTYSDMLQAGMDTFPGPTGMKDKMESIINEAKKSHSLPAFLMTDEFYIIKALVTYKSLNKYFDKIYDFCIETLENDFYIYDEVVASKFASSVLDFIQDNMWVDAIPSTIELEIRKN